MRDYVSGDEDNDPIQPPRTSHIDGVMTVIIDPGHGGSDVGANNGGSLDEKHVNLYVAQYLKQYLEAAGAKVIMVRDTLEEGSELTLRGAVMKQYASSADLFFSIHHNAANTTARGADSGADCGQERRTDQNSGAGAAQRVRKAAFRFARSCSARAVTAIIITPTVQQRR